MWGPGCGAVVGCVVLDDEPDSQPANDIPSPACKGGPWDLPSARGVTYHLVLVGERDRSCSFDEPSPNDC